MPTERLALRHVRDVIRLKSAGMPIREIARRMGTAPSMVRLTVGRFEAAGLTWPLPNDITDTELEEAGGPVARQRGSRSFCGAGGLALFMGVDEEQQEARWRSVDL